MTFEDFLEDFLKEKHAEQYTGTDDDMSDDYDNWVSELEVQDVIDYAEEALKKQNHEM